LGLEERRAILDEMSDALAPGSGSPYENSYLETIVWADLDLPL